MIDLHSHTLHSDGQRSPDELVGEAVAAGVKVLSLTDHDTVSGIADATASATRRGIRLVPGIELSCELHGREVHVLGHFLDPRSGALLQLAADMLEERRERMERMVARAQQAGFKQVTMERVIAASGGENLGRPHLARALVDCGHAKSVKDAFDRFLHSRGPLWVDRRRVSVAEAVGLVRSAGGTSSIAHPGASLWLQFSDPGLATSLATSGHTLGQNRGPRRPLVNTLPRPGTVSASTSSCKVATMVTSFFSSVDGRHPAAELGRPGGPPARQPTPGAPVESSFHRRP